MSETKRGAGVALVTGASSGMGKEYARQLAARGYELLLVSNQAEALEQVADELAGESRERAPHGERASHDQVAPHDQVALHDQKAPRPRTLCVDLAQHGAAEKVMAWCDAMHKTPDILINDAGMFFMEYLSPHNLPKARSMIALHVETVTDLCVFAADRMKNCGLKPVDGVDRANEPTCKNSVTKGRHPLQNYILNVSSMTAEIPAPGIAIYSATKAYLKSFGRSLSYELRPFGIGVTTVCPSAVDTNLYPLKPSQRELLKRLGIIRTPQWLVRKSLKAMFRGRRVLSPGFTNVLVPLLVKLMPSRLIDKLGMKWIYRS